MAIIQKKAIEIASTYGIYDFTASNGWFAGFVSRFNIVRRVPRGEASDVEIDAIRSDIVDIRRKLDKYKGDNIFNMDETGLFFRALPGSLYGRSRVICSRDVRGTKAQVAKDRLTLVIFSNATGKNILNLDTRPCSLIV